MGRWRMKESQDESWSERGRGGEFVKPNQPWGERGEEEDYCTRQVLTSRQQRRDEDVWPWCRQLSANQGSSQWPTQTPKTQIRIHHFFSHSLASYTLSACVCVCVFVMQVIFQLKELFYMDVASWFLIFLGIIRDNKRESDDRTLGHTMHKTQQKTSESMKFFLWVLLTDMSKITAGMF